MPPTRHHHLMPQYYFFYGTLRPGASQVANGLTKKLIGHGRATVRGHLGRIGPYPALVPDDTGPQVDGVLMAVTPAFGANDLAAMHAWEDYNPKAPERSLYDFTTLTATRRNGETVTAHVYIAGPKARVTGLGRRRLTRQRG